VGGTFTGSAINDAGDFQWLDMSGEYLDHKPGIAEGDPFPWVASARCVTTREEFKQLCDNFELSWNGLSKMGAPVQGYHDFDGHFSARTANRAHVEPNGGGPVNATSEVDGDTGDVDEVSVTFENGLTAGGDVNVSTLADAHGELPANAEFPPRGTTEIDHGDGPVPFFETGDETFIEITTNAGLPHGPDIEVCLPRPPASSAADVRPVRVLHGEGDNYMTRRFVDRTSSVDPTKGKACASVSGFSRFAVVEADYCGRGRRSADGILTVAGGLRGRKNVIVDGVTDCTHFPAGLPQSMHSLCVPDGDGKNGQCMLELTVGVDRTACNTVEPTVDASEGGIDPWSYEGSIRGMSTTIDLYSTFHDELVLRSDWTDLVLGPKTIALPLTGSSTKYKLSQRMNGAEPGTGDYVSDRDTVSIVCVAPPE